MYSIGDQADIRIFIQCEIETIIESVHETAEESGFRGLDAVDILRV